MTKDDKRLINKLRKETKKLLDKVSQCPHQRMTDWYRWIEDPNNGLSAKEREEQLDQWINSCEAMYGI